MMKVSKRLILDPQVYFEYTDRELPKWAPERRDRVLPASKKSRIDIELPI
jgi:hypothetical protein